MTARQLSDGNDDGTKLGQSASDKISFFGADTTTQPAHTADATDATTTMSAVNSILADLRALGLKASS